MEHKEVVSGRGLVVRKHLGLENMTVDEFNEEELNLMASGTKLGLKRVGSRNETIQKNAKRFAY